MHMRDKCWKWKSEVYFTVDRTRMNFLLLCCTWTRALQALILCWDYETFILHRDRKELNYMLTTVFSCSFAQ